MARNKYPEETIKLILDVASRLFIQKGYEKTSLQDIIQETKLSKGAIYHHFASKEEIFMQVCERIGQENEIILGRVRDDRTLNGKQKLQKLFRTSLESANQQKMLDFIPYLLDYPKFMAAQMRSIYEEVVPDYVEPILNEGIADGSIQTEHPKELAEALMLLSDCWLHPLIRPTTPEETRARCQVYNRITGAFGLELLDDETIEMMVGFSVQVQNRSRRGAQSEG